MPGLMKKTGDNAVSDASPQNPNPRPKTPLGQKLFPIIFFLLLLYGITVVALILVDAKVKWMPQDVVGSVFSDISFYMNNPAKTVPENIVSSLPVSGFVDKQFVPALELINRDQRFKYLADMVVKHKIKIIVNDNIPGNSEYSETCPQNAVGTLSVTSSFASSRTDILAGVLVHELTHAYNRITANPSYYCTPTHHMSDEMDARRNHYEFWYEYNHLLFFGPYTTGMIDLRGNIQEYCLYEQIKKSQPYSTWPDDANVSPTPEEKRACSIASYL